MIAAVKIAVSMLRNRALLRALVRQEFRQRYAGSLIGFAWAFINPALTIFVLWIVLGYGLKQNSSEAAPFFLVLLTKFLPWMVFAEAFGGGAGSISSRSYLITKIAFPLEVLPAVPLALAVMVHIAILSIFIVVLAVSGIAIAKGLLLLPFYLGALCLFCLGLNLLTSILSMFFKDFAIAIPAIANIWFWITPIVWSATAIPERYGLMLAFNPMTFIVEGYSNAILGTPLPANFPAIAIAFGICTAFVLLVGCWAFQRLKPELADLV